MTYTMNEESDTWAVSDIPTYLLVLDRINWYKGP